MVLSFILPHVQHNKVDNASKF